MNSGDFDQRIEFTEIQTVTDEDGFEAEKEVPFAKTWAALKTLRDSSFYAAAQSGNEDNRQFQMRYRRDIVEKYRNNQVTGLRWRDIDHHIESFEEDDGQRKTITIFVSVKNANTPI